MYCYCDDGLSFRWVGPGYAAQTGEVTFADVATSDQLTTAFPGYAAAVLAQAQAAQTAALQASAQAALTKSDITLTRVYEASLKGTPAAAADITAWTAYRQTLRAIVAGSGAALPERPAYPAGT
jgi:hypothetical protein